MNQKKLFTTNQLVYLSLLTAVTVILKSRYLSIETDYIKVSFKFISVSLSAVLFGPFPTALMASVADIVSVFISGKSIHLGFTLSEFVTGLIYGYFYYKKPNKYKSIIIANTIVLILITGILNSIWLYQFYGANFTKSMWFFRIIKELVFLPIKIKLTYEINILVFSRLKNRFKLNKAN